MQFNRLNKKDLHQDSFPLNAGHSSHSKLTVFGYLNLK